MEKKNTNENNLQVQALEIDTPFDIVSYFDNINLDIGSCPRIIGAVDIASKTIRHTMSKSGNTLIETPDFIYKFFTSEDETQKLFLIELKLSNNSNSDVNINNYWKTLKDVIGDSKVTPRELLYDTKYGYKAYFTMLLQELGKKAFSVLSLLNLDFVSTIIQDKGKEYAVAEFSSIQLQKFIDIAHSVDLPLRVITHTELDVVIADQSELYKENIWQWFFGKGGKKMFKLEIERTIFPLTPKKQIIYSYLKNATEFKEINF